MIRQLLALIFLACFAATAAAADESWLLTNSSFQTQRVMLRKLDQAGASLVPTSAGGPTLIEWDRLLILSRTGRPAAPNTRFIVNLNGQDRAAGEPRGIEGETLVWENPALGRLSLPLRSVQSIVRPGDEAVPSAPQTEDVVTLLNRDSVRGIIASIDNTAVTVQSAAGDQTPVPLDSIARVSFAATAAQPATRPRGFRVTLTDGSAITASAVAMADGQSKITLSFPDGPERSFESALVTGIEQVNGPVVWLSGLTPGEAVHSPFFELSWPPRMDRAVDGEPLRFFDRVYARGIGVHSRSVLTYAIDPRWQTFRTQYAIAGDWPYADVTVRIKLDGQVVHEQPNFRAGTLHAPVNIDVKGRQQLTLEVDYGGNFDVQDRFNWIEPAFLTFQILTEPPLSPPPASSPATGVSPE